MAFKIASATLIERVGITSARALSLPRRNRDQHTTSLMLPSSIERDELHIRSIDLRGYRRQDGLFDIEAHLTDIKRHPLHPPGRDDVLPPGTPIHDMWVRLVVDASLIVADIVAVTDAGPYPDCPAAASSLGKLRGAKIGPGWSSKVKDALGGVQSCTHLVELLIPLATVAYQTLAPERFAHADPLDAAGRPIRIDSCYAYASHRAVVRKRWPEQYTGPESGPSDPPK